MQPKAPGGYLPIWFVLFGWVLVHFFVLVNAPQPSGVGDAMVRAAHILATASAVTLLGAMIHFRPWVVRAAQWWAIAMGTFYALRLFTGTGAMEWQLSFGQVLLPCLLVGAGAYYVSETAEQRLGLAPPPQPVPRVTPGGAP